MRKKFQKLLCLSLAILCMVSSIPTQTDRVLAGDSSIVQEGCMEITTSANTANDSLIYFKEKVKGAVTIEYDVKFNQFQGAVFGFGLMSDSSAPNPYASKLFFTNSQSFYTPWSPAYVSAQTTWQNYNENYWGVYMYHRVRIKLVVAENGDATLYAKSIEPSSSYAGTNSQQTEYVQVSDTIKGIYSTETAATNGAYIAMFFRGGTQSMYYYGMKATDSTGAVYAHDFTSENLSDDFKVSDGFATDLTNKQVIYTQAVVEESTKTIEFDISSDVTFTQGGADGYNLPYLKFVVTESEASAWSIYPSGMIEYKRADGTIESIGDLVCINAGTKEMQLRLAGTGVQWVLKDGDTVTFKKGLKIVENDTRIEQLARDRKFIYVAEKQSFLNEEQYLEYISVPFDISSDVTFTQGGADGYNLPYLKFVVTESEASAWSIYPSGMIEYKRADGTIESIGNLVCINADTNEMQLRLAGTGVQWVLKDGDTVTFKKGLKIVENDTRIEQLARDREFVYVAKKGEFIAEYYDDSCYYKDITPYRQTTFTAPEAPVGYVFGGWYRDKDYTEWIGEEVTSGGAFAKFVDKDVLSVRPQVKLDGSGEVPTGSTDMRFATTVDSLTYRSVSFYIATQKDGNYGSETDTANIEENPRLVYTKLYYVGSTSEIESYMPTIFSRMSTHFKTFTLRGIPSSAYDTNIKVTPYWKTMDGTIVRGETLETNVNKYKEEQEIKVDKSLLFGMDEPISEGEMNGTWETSQVNGFSMEATANLAGALGCKSFRFRIPSGFITAPGQYSENGYEYLQQAITRFHNVGVENLIGMAMIFPQYTSFSPDSAYSAPRPDDPSYGEWLEAVSNMWEELASLFPEIDKWELGNEFNHKVFFHPNGYQSIEGVLGGYNGFTDEEQYTVVTDYMYYASKGVKRGNPDAKCVAPGVAPIDLNLSAVEEFYENIYTYIGSGNAPYGEVKSTNPDDYFDYLCWHPYTSQLDETWLKKNNAIYQVAINHGDEGKPVIFTEFGFSDSGAAELQKTQCGYLETAFKYMSEQMPYLETCCEFRMYTCSYAINWGEINEVYYGCMSEATDQVGLSPREKAYVIQKIFGGTGDLTKYQ